MRSMTVVLILLSLFIALVGSRFKPSDGDKLAAVSRLMAGKVRDALPPANRLAGPVNALWNGTPGRIEQRVKTRLDTDRRLEGVEFTITADGGAITLRGVVPDAAARKRAVALAENTSGVESVTDELAVME